jgi:hypothetical protein
MPKVTSKLQPSIGPRLDHRGSLRAWPRLALMLCSVPSPPLK